MTHWEMTKIVIFTREYFSAVLQVQVWWAMLARIEASVDDRETRVRQRITNPAFNNG